MRNHTPLFFCLFSFFFFGVLIHPNGPFDVVKIQGGSIAGIANANGDIHIFKGIPFASPPVGTLRWKAPQPVEHWFGVKLCNQFGPSPMQGAPLPFSMWSQEFLIPKEPISEDCLYLNVWTGASAPKDKLPVVVWIYGGGFASGGSGVPIYDGEAMAKKGIIFVSINYRVGIFGFFAHAQLSKESEYHSSGNYGLLDQLAALKWVRNNIAQFGGDPQNVTIAGQSAGAMSVNCLVASPLAKNLFQKAIAESGASFTRQNNSLKFAETEGDKIMQSLNVNSIDAMRTISAEELLKNAKGQYAPTIDGYFLPASIVDIFNNGAQNKVPLLTGWNEEEGLLRSPIKNAADYKNQIEETYSEDAPTLLKYYPAINDSEASKSQQNLSRDAFFGIQNYAWANMESEQGLPVYVYRFVRRPPATGEYKKFGTFHTAEVPYAYNNLAFVDRPWEPIDYQLANTMSSYWANFIKNGNPNQPGLPRWPSYQTNKKEIMLLGKTLKSVLMPNREGLDFLYKISSGKSKQ
jgi:para-nitrobenzyl esterase